MRLSVFVILLAVHLSAHGQCTIVPYSIPAGCNTTSCPAIPNGFYESHLWNPTITIACAEREFVTLRVNVDHQYMADEYYGEPIDKVLGYLSGYAQKVNLYAEDQYGDMGLVGTGDFTGLSSAEFTIHGSTAYMFTFQSTSAYRNFEIVTSPLPYCKLPFGSEKILKADDVNSAQYQCSLYIDSVEQSIVQTHGLNGCTHYRCQYFADRKTLVFCEGTLTDEVCYQKADYVWFIGTEYDLSSLPKVMIYLTLLILYFLGIASGLRA